MKNKLIIFGLVALVYMPKIYSADEKEIKFFSADGVCIFEASQVKEAAEYLPESGNTQVKPLKLALTILQLKSFQGKPFLEVDCAIKYFYEMLSASVKSESLLNRYGITDEIKSIAKDFIFTLEKIKSNDKYKKEMSKALENSSTFKGYYDLYKYFPEFLEGLDEASARKVFEVVVTQVKNGSITTDEWNQIFRLYFKKKIPLPPHVKEYISYKLLRTYGTSNSDFLNNYFAMVDDFSYQSFFKEFFESIPSSDLGHASIFNFNNWRQTVPQIFSSKYFSEAFKCRLAKEFIPAMSRNLKLSDYDVLRKIDHPCLKNSLSFLDHFKESLNGCPEIILKPGDNAEEILKNASFEFISKWIDCRKQCTSGDSCVEANEGLADYFNSKFEKDKNIFLMLNESSKYSTIHNSNFLTYKIKSSGVCDKNVCKENLKSCLVSDLVAKVEEELKEAHFKDCKVDADCFPFFYAEDCALSVVNKKISIYTNWSFPSTRLARLKKQCGSASVAIMPPEMCAHRNKIDTQKIKCEANFCVVK